MTLLQEIHFLGSLLLVLQPFIFIYAVVMDFLDDWEEKEENTRAGDETSI